MMDPGEGLWRLRAIHLLLQTAAERLPDQSRSAQPYEMSAAEMRDIDRIATGDRARTQIGRDAIKRAKAGG